MPQLTRQSFDSAENIMGILFDRGPDPMANTGPPFSMLPLDAIEIYGLPAGKSAAHMPATPGAPGAIADLDLSQDGQHIGPAAGQPVNSASLL